MNKTVKVNLGGLVFEVDENAFEKLNQYIESIKKRFAQTEGKEDIINDIETRIAEIFNGRLQKGVREVVNMADVDEAISVMGRPEEFEGAGDEEEEAETAEETQDTAQQKHLKKRLFRNPDDKVLGGVASGISAYFGINDPLWLRLLFVILVVAGVGTFILIYIILWIIVPEAKTPSEKLQMRGENVNISNIESSVRQEFDDLKNRFSSMNSNQTMSAVGGFLSKVIDFLVNLFRYVLYFGVKALGVLLIFGGIAALLFMVFGFAVPFGLPGFDFVAVSSVIFGSTFQSVLSAIGLLLIAGIPVLAIVYVGFRILMDTRARVKGLAPTMIGLWVLGLILITVNGSLLAMDFSNKEELSETVTLNQPNNGKLYIKAKANEGTSSKSGFIHLDEMDVVNGNIVLNDAVHLDIQRAESDDFQLRIDRSARGGTPEEARSHAKRAEFDFQQKDSSIFVNPVLSLPKANRWRAQQVHLTLLVPTNDQVVLTESSRDVIYDIENVHDMYDGNMVGHTWKMKQKGLTCVSCSATDLDNESSVSGTSRNFDIKGYNQVEVNGAFDVDISYAEDYKTVLKGPEDLLDDVDVAMSNDELTVSKQEGVGDILEDGTVKVIVETPALEDIEIKGAGESSVTGLSGKSCEITLAGATEGDMNISYQELKVEVLGASSLHLVGSGKTLNAEVLGASNMNAKGYEVEDAELEVAGSSDARVNATKNLKAEVLGASEVKYVGQPDIDSETAGFSSIEQLP